MATISIVFRVPVVDATGEYPPPFMNFRCRDDEEPRMWRGCGHRHKTKATAAKCAKAMSLGQTIGAVNQRIETRGFGKRVQIGDGFAQPRRRHSRDGSIRCDICAPLRCEKARD